MNSCICTIVDSNYLQQARVLSESLVSSGMTQPFFVLLTDLEDEKSINLGWCTAVSLKFLDENKSLSEMKRFYNLIEFSTALKPRLIEVLLHSFNRVTFLDPDVYCFSDFTALMPETNSIFITPHRLSPVMEESKVELEKSFLKYGIYNLGFISVGRGSECFQFLEWWKRHLHFSATHFVDESTFTDQKWIDLATCYFPLKLHKDPGMNVAVWNLDERSQLLLDFDFGLKSNILKFFHFSQLSRQLAYSGEVDTSPHLVLQHLSPEVKDRFKELLKFYSDALKKHHTLKLELERVGIKFMPLAKELPKISRRLMRDKLRQGQRPGLLVLFLNMSVVRSSLIFLERSRAIQFLLFGLLLDTRKILEKSKFRRT